MKQRGGSDVKISTAPKKGYFEPPFFLYISFASFPPSPNVPTPSSTPRRPPYFPTLPPLRRSILPSSHSSLVPKSPRAWEEEEEEEEEKYASNLNPRNAKRSKTPPLSHSSITSSHHGGEGGSFAPFPEAKCVFIVVVFHSSAAAVVVVVEIFEFSPFLPSFSSFSGESSASPPPSASSSTRSCTTFKNSRRHHRRGRGSKRRRSELG